MNKMKISVGILVLFLVVLVGACFSLYQKNKTSCETNSGNQELSLIDNEYTKNLNKLPDGWKVYKNAEYGFQINYPETTFDGSKINIQDVKFKSREDLAATGGDQKIGGGTGSYKTVREIIDFNTTVERNGDAGVIKGIDSLFAVGIHPNESNLSFEEFVSQEILSYYKGSEIIKSQKIVEVNGVTGYEFTYAYSNGGEAIAYYLPSKDNKTIFSVNTAFALPGAIEIEGVIDTGDVMLGYSNANPQFSLKDIEATFFQDANYYPDGFNFREIEANFAKNGQDPFLKKYPGYQLFEKEFTIKYLQKEWAQQETFNQVVSSLSL